MSAVLTLRCDADAAAPLVQPVTPSEVVTVSRDQAASLRRIAEILSSNSSALVAVRQPPVRPETLPALNVRTRGI